MTDDLQALLEQQQGYTVPTLASYIPTPEKQKKAAEDEQQAKLMAMVEALRNQPVIGGGMGGGSASTGKVTSANAGLASGIGSGVDMGMGIAKALKTPTPYSAPADLAGTSFI